MDDVARKFGETRLVTSPATNERWRALSGFERADNFSESPGVQDGKNEIPGGALGKNDPFIFGSLLFHRGGEFTKSPSAVVGQIGQRGFITKFARDLLPAFVKHLSVS